MRVVVIDPPTPVISLEEARVHLRVDDDVHDEDDLIQTYIDAATDHIAGPNGWLGISVGRQTLELVRPSFDCDTIRLPYGPVAEDEAVEITYRDDAGDAQVLDAGTYEVEGGVVRLAAGYYWPATGSYSDAVRIRYVAGYEEVPPPIRAALLLHVGLLYANRESAGAVEQKAVPMAYETLLSPFRVYS